MEKYLPQRLPEEIWAGVVNFAPLVSIDIIISDDNHRILLGKRTNRPAQGYWFTPGCSVRKNEKLEDAFDRCLQEELNTRSKKRRRDYSSSVYEHFYPDSFLRDDMSTHYVVVAHRMCITDLHELNPEMPVDQHSEYKWWDLNGLMGSSEVHDFVKDYFRIL